MAALYLTYEKIKPEMFLDSEAENPCAGGSVIFFGTVRKLNHGREVDYLVYEAYEPMAEKKIGGLIAKAFRIWPVLEARILHRLGRLQAGDIAVAIRVSSEHRDESYHASRFLIDRIKEEVPIWKKEFFKDGGSEWGRCSHHTSGQDQRRFKTDAFCGQGRRGVHLWPYYGYLERSREREMLNETMF